MVAMQEKEEAIIFVNNYYKPGPVTNTKKNIVNRIFQPNGDDGTNKTPKVYGVLFI